MNKKEQYNFLKEFKDLLDKYNIEIITCGCCDGMGFYDKNSTKWIFDMIRSNAIDSLMEKLERESE